MASKKSKRISIVGLIIAALAALWYFKFRNPTLTDKYGNKFTLDKSVTVTGGYQVLMNGQPIGALLNLDKRPDGRVGGTDSAGTKYSYGPAAWERV